jgi:hypothetical protein
MDRQRRWVNLFALFLFSLVAACSPHSTSRETPGEAASALTSVTWTDIVGVDAVTNNLTKTAGAGWNAGAASVESLASDGYVEFSTAEASTYKMAGLSHGDTNADYADIDFAFYLTATGGVAIYEAGALIGSFGTYAAGDVFRVQTTSGQIRYFKNGALLYTSNSVPTAPLLVDTSLFTTGATITDVVLQDTPLFWQNRVGVQVSDDGRGITKTFQSNGFDAGASSIDSLADDGYVEFSTSEVGTNKFAGLSHGDTGNGFNEIAFAVYLNSNGEVFIYESGAVRGFFGGYAPNDVFRVTLSGNQVSYAKNGTVFYTSSSTPTLPLLLDTSLGTFDATITNASFTHYWQNLSGVSTSRHGLTKTGAAGWNAGASTSASFSGNCAGEFTTLEANTYKMAGLSHGDSSTDYTDIDYAFSLAGDGSLSLYEAGTYLGTVGPYAANDVFRIEAIGGVVSYYQNQNLLYTSSTTATAPLLFDTSLYSPGATIANLDFEAAYWTKPIGVSVSGHDITKTGTGGWNAGASSADAITGDGFAEFTTFETSTFKMAGLSNGDSNADYTDIDYAFYMLGNGQLMIYEAGTSIGAFGTYAVGDDFRLQVVGGVVTYYQNGNPLYTSQRAPTLPLVVDSSLFSTGATIKNLNVGSDWFWVNPIGVSTAPHDLTKTGATGWNAGASSSQIVTAAGYTEFTTAENNTNKMAGLTSGGSSGDYRDVDFAVYLTAGGLVQIYEAGVNRASVGSYSAGDVFRVEVGGTVVTYSKNGNVIYTSQQPPVFPLRIGTALYDTSATIENAVLVVNPDPGFWQNIVGLSVTNVGTDIVKNAGTSAWDAGASSRQALAGDGYVEFTTGETDTFKLAGLSHGDSSVDYTDVDFAFYMTGTGALAIYEGGAIIGPIGGAFGTYAANDVFRVELGGDQISYRQNGVLLYTSPLTPTLPLLLDTSLYSPGATILGATFGAPFWQNTSGVLAVGNDLTKTGTGGWNAGASSASSIAGNGYVEFRSAEATTLKMAGLSHGDTNFDYSDIDYAFALTQDGVIAIYEDGTYVGTAGTYAANDLFRVEVNAGQVSYRRNGVLLYTSTKAPTSPLLFDTSLYTPGATIDGVAVVSGP